jgi:phenylalanyl-tRNA synthetase beta chain
MNISYRWLGDLVPGLSLSPQEVADRLAMLGAPVDDLVDLGGPLRDVVIARVEHAGRHPNADRLSLCTVDAGAGHTVQVVCGAPNVRSGGYYPFAPVGATLPGGVTIRRAKIRGEESQGMLCSPRELGLGRDHEGIMELHGEFEAGRSFIEALGMDDARLELDVTPNRPDLLSHLGVARELAAATGLEARLHQLSGAPQVAVDGWRDAPATAAGVTVRVEDAALCSRYYGLVIRGVSVGPSPEWLATRLRAIGLRPINNVVDATNYVLHELGQPLHAFDLARIGSKVVVRPARAGERIVTLDDVERTLGEGMLVIADATRPVAVAGVMGGADTEVDATTRDLLLECAHFDPRSVRATRRALGLSTDASYRFERGVDPDGLLEALRRVATLIVAVAGGSVEAVPAAAGPGLPAPPPVRLRLGRVRQVLGESIAPERVAALLRPLGFAVREQAAGSLDVDVPGHRRYDVAREEDLIEDIARHYGYDAFPDELRPFRPSSVPDHPLFHLEDRLRTLLVARGFLEARTAAFAPEPLGDVALLHPLAATEGRLRRALLPGLVRRIEYNFARGAASIRLFELGTAFTLGAEGGVPAEETRLAVAFTGLRRPAHWSEAAAPCDVWDLKGLLEEIAAELGLNVEEAVGSSIIEQAAGHLGLRLAPAAGATLLEPGLAFRLLGAGGDARGAAGRVLPSHVDAPAWAHDVWGVEVGLVERHAPAFVRHRPLPSFPPVERDLALLLPDALDSARVVDAVRSSAGGLLESVEPFDLYRGAGVPDGARSVAYRLRFRATDRTLTDAEVDAAVQRTLQHLDRELGVQQRA